MQLYTSEQLRHEIMYIVTVHVHVHVCIAACV